MESVSLVSVNLKPNKPEPFGGERDYLIVHTWLYKMEQYLNLLQIANPSVVLNDTNRIVYASTFFSGNAAVWWYTMVQGNTAPTAWIDFKAAIVKEFVPEDHVRRARDKLRRLKQTGSVAKYLSEFRNIVLTVPDITNNEKWDIFCSGLKYEVRLEVMKSTVSSFEEAAKIALRVDSALFSASSGRPDLGGSQVFGSSSRDVPTPMEIGNLEKERTGRRFKMTPQRMKDLRTGACFVCHKARCRPWKHKKEASISNTEVFTEEEVDSPESNGADDENPKNFVVLQN